MIQFHLFSCLSSQTLTVEVSNLFPPLFSFLIYYHLFILKVLLVQYYFSKTFLRQGRTQLCCPSQGSCTIGRHHLTLHCRCSLLAQSELRELRDLVLFAIESSSAGAVRHMSHG